MHYSLSKEENDAVEEIKGMLMIKEVSLADVAHLQEKFVALTAKTKGYLLSSRQEQEISVAIFTFWLRFSISMMRDSMFSRKKDERNKEIVYNHFLKYAEASKFLLSRFFINPQLYRGESFKQIEKRLESFFENIRHKKWCVGFFEGKLPSNKEYFEQRGHSRR